MPYAVPSHEMLKSQLSMNGGPVAHFHDSSVEDACSRIRKLAHELVDAARQDMKGRQITLFIGMMPGGGIESMPRKHSNSALDLGLDELALLAVLDRSLRLHHHPAVRNTTLDADHSQNTLTVTDCKGNEYVVTITKKA